MSSLHILTTGPVILPWTSVLDQCILHLCHLFWSRKFRKFSRFHTTLPCSLETKSSRALFYRSLARKIPEIFHFLHNLWLRARNKALAIARALFLVGWLVRSRSLEKITALSKFIRARISRSRSKFSRSENFSRSLFSLPLEKLARNFSHFYTSNSCSLEIKRSR